jgi:hypothetical protein
MRATQFTQAGHCAALSVVAQIVDLAPSAILQGEAQSAMHLQVAFLSQGLDLSIMRISGYTDHLHLHIHTFVSPTDVILQYGHLHFCVQVGHCTDGLKACLLSILVAHIVEDAEPLVEQLGASVSPGFVWPHVLGRALHLLGQVLLQRLSQGRVVCFVKEEPLVGVRDVPASHRQRYTQLRNRMNDCKRRIKG